jgi:hypothetical protein
MLSKEARTTLAARHKRHKASASTSTGTSTSSTGSTGSTTGTTDRRELLWAIGEQGRQARGVDTSNINPLGEWARVSGRPLYIYI